MCRLPQPLQQLRPFLCHAREIAEQANRQWGEAINGPDVSEIAARLGIIEGLEMAAKWHDERAEKRFADQESLKELAPVSSYQAFNDACEHQEHATAIRALIEESKG